MNNLLLFPKLSVYCTQVSETFDAIPPARKKQLETLSSYIDAQLEGGKTPQLTVICTHNSRRSHIGQLFLAISAVYYGIPIKTYSGGTEATAFNANAIAALRKTGLEIEQPRPSPNPRYNIRWSKEMTPYTAFSKCYDEAPNPSKNFGAILVCTSADKGCPVVLGADFRLALPFDDPKAFDGTTEQAVQYEKSCREIGREMLYAISLLKHQIMRKTIIRLQENVAKLKNEIHHIKEETLAYKPRPEKWSRKEILGHLIDSARYNLMRFNEIPLAKDIYAVVSYPQNELVPANDYQHCETSELVIIWQALNRQIARTMSKIPNAVLSKQITINGAAHSFEFLLVDYVDHLEYHLAQIIAPCEEAEIKIPTQTSILDAAEMLKSVPTEFVKLVEFGDLEIEYYQPLIKDKQQPHDRDELYVIIQGSSDFIVEGKRFTLATSDVLFVKAGDKHQFVDFSEDFATWVIFYGLKR